MDRTGRDPRAGGSRQNALFMVLLLLYVFEFTGVIGRLPVLKALHFATLLSMILGAALLAGGGFREVLKHRLAVLLLILISFTFLGLSYCLIKTRTFQFFLAHAGYFIMFAAIPYLITTERKLHIFLATVLVVHALIILLNLKLLTSGVRAGQISAGYFIGDGNDFAWALGIVLPFAIYFLMRPGIGAKMFGAIMSAALPFGIVMTMSRGGFLAVGCSFLYFSFFTKRKIAGLLIVAVFACGVAFAAPQAFWNRMDPSGYMEDHSARSRLQAWRSAISMATHHPLGVGAGNFQSIYGRYYVDSSSNQLEWGARRWISPHSIYFSVLAEYGILGLLLLLAIIGEMLRMGWKVRNNKLSGHFPAFLGMSVVAFAAGGAFLGGIKYPHMYILAGLCLACSRIFGTRDAHQ